jgi:hypothetical protein
VKFPQVLVLARCMKRYCCVVLGSALPAGAITGHEHWGQLYTA